MPAPHLLACFFGGAFLANAVPHFVSGMMGRPFQSPFATPRGVGLSSSTVNVVWGFANLAIGFWLTWRVGDLDAHNDAGLAALALGSLPMSLFAARHFGRFHGGNAPEQS